MEEMMMMMKIRSPENPRKFTTIPADSITTSICPTWKLYENPFYISQQQQDNHHHKQRQDYSSNKKQIHHLHLPISARKIAASFWDLTFIKPLMESELESARAQILELKAELENERKARKKMESMNKKLSRELSEERKGREALGRMCEELARETSSNKAEISRLKKEMEEERKMLRVAEVLREERVQMKLSEAKHLLEEKLIELEATKQMQNDSSSLNSQAKIEDENAETSVDVSSSDHTVDSSSGEAITRSALTEKLPSNSDHNSAASAMGAQKRASQEPENPHIKRGIKGFVEFPKVVKAIGSKSIRRSGTKLECQKAQIRMLLKQKNPLRSNTLITS